ncbi:uncharacterized protein SAMN05216436_109128 [bacterium A37T11]|nr:uncharacterized protein SAMN05216436_109128 [bacterium A37T11]
MTHEIKIAAELSIGEKQVRTTIALLNEGSTIPFIARYRKEATGSLDEVQVAAIRDRLLQLRELDKRRMAILESLKEQGKLSPELEQQIEDAETMAVLEDLYLPYRPKRKTRASTAKEKGLEPLALTLLKQEDSIDPYAEAEKYLDDSKGVMLLSDALSGARDILAEQMMENANLRALVREIYLKKGMLVSKVVPGKEAEGIKYKDYYDWLEPIKSIPSHRMLAVRRGEKEEKLYLDIQIPEFEGIDVAERLFITGTNASAEQVKLAIADGFKRLLKPSMETEIRVMLREQADKEAIQVFTENVRQLLLAAPLGQKRLLAIDPGFRTGCKVVCLDEQGKLLESLTIYPHLGGGKELDSDKTIRLLVDKYRIEAIAIGNGTAGRETEVFIKRLALADIPVIMVNESGASIYSASEVAREEFPDQDITVRGAVSIGRRLMDPLAELVKIDPKSIGVGQYQHDVDQTKLITALDDTVMSCVNAVGVELNTASKQLLTYVSGLGPSLAQQIVNYRQENGAFKSREDLKKVPRLGVKAFEQAAGFLRIHDAENPLDASAVHPEQYPLVEKMAADRDTTVGTLLKDPNIRQSIPLKDYMTDEVGLPTLTDIMAELDKPGRDPREQFEAFSFSDEVNSINDLKVDMVLPGIVTNITKFGAFVDIGVHQDGLVHLSQLTSRYIQDPNEVVKVQQHVQVRVTEVDAERKRISLSMRSKEKPVIKQKPAGKQKQVKPVVKQQPPKSKKAPQTQEKAVIEPEMDMAAKLQALKAKFSI